VKISVGNAAFGVISASLQELGRAKEAANVIGSVCSWHEGIPLRLESIGVV
jgi:hypothetical protein